MRNKEGNIYAFTTSLSDENGDILIYGFENNNKHYIIKNSKGEIQVSDKLGHISNAVAAKSADGYYYIVVVAAEKMFFNHLRIYKFDKNGNYLGLYITEETGFTFCVSFIHKRNGSLILLAYNSNEKSIKTYNLEDGIISKISESNADLEGIYVRTNVGYNIAQSRKGKIVVSSVIHPIFYIIDYNNITNKIQVTEPFKTEKFYAVSFTENDKYFLIIDDSKLKGFKYDENFDFNLENPDIVYGLPEKEKANILWCMNLGNDGKIYIHCDFCDYILVLDGIETGEITEERILSDYLKCMIVFPQITRFPKTSDCLAAAAFDNATVCNKEPLKVILSGTAPFEVFYTFENEEKSFLTSEKEYLMDNIFGKYKITKVKDNSCETLPSENNTAEIIKETKTPKIIEKQ
jgi:hypothetical protein